MRINNTLKRRSALLVDLPKLDWHSLTAIIYTAEHNGWVDIGAGVTAKEVRAIGCVLLKYNGQIVARIGQGYSHRMTYLDAGDLPHTEELRDLFQKVLADTGARSDQIECWLHDGKLIIVDKVAAYPLMTDHEEHGKLGTMFNQQIVGYRWARVALDSIEGRVPGDSIEGRVPGDSGWGLSQRAEYLLEYMALLGWKHDDEYIKEQMQ